MNQLTAAAVALACALPAPSATPEPPVTSPRPMPRPERVAPAACTFAQPCTFPTQGAPWAATSEETDR